MPTCCPLLMVSLAATHWPLLIISVVVKGCRPLNHLSHVPGLLICGTVVTFSRAIKHCGPPKWVVLCIYLPSCGAVLIFSRAQKRREPLGRPPICVNLPAFGPLMSLFRTPKRQGLFRRVCCPFAHLSAAGEFVPRSEA